MMCGCSDVTKIQRSERVIDFHCFRHGLSWIFDAGVPSMTDERLESLRSGSRMLNGQFGANGVSESRELITEIDRLRAELAAKEAECERMRTALEPLVAVCEAEFATSPLIADEPDESSVYAGVEDGVGLTFGHIRRGRAALNPEAAE